MTGPGKARRARAPCALALIAAAAAIAAGCGGGEPDLDTVAEPPTGTTSDAGGGAQAVGDGRGGVRLEPVGEFEQPIYVTQPTGGGDLYVVEQGGTVRIVRGGETLPEPFLDLSAQVTAGGEQGLLSIAFDPDFEANRLLYAYFTDRDGNQRLVRLRAADDERVQPDSQVDLLVMEDFASNHNGGLIAFGPDGNLYVGTGDGGGAGDPERSGQDLSSLLGKILRIAPLAGSDSPGYAIPADNPFADEAGARPEVYAYGLRNPWRFSFDRATGALSIGDVGQSDFEEIDYVSRGEGSGANFGWSAFEGEAEFNSDQEAPGHVPPVLAYGRDRGCSVTGGYVVRDPELESLYGRYLYGDFCEGELRSFIPRPGAARDDRSLGLTVPELSSFGEDSEGRVYVVSLEGTVYAIRPR